MMGVPLQLIVLSIPSLIYVAVRKWRGERWNNIFEKIGWQGSPPIYFLWALGAMAIVAGLGWLAFQFIPSEVLQDPNINIAGYAGWTLSITSFLLAWLREAIYVALGEEIFFRGFLGGWLVRRLGFMIGNVIQTLIFLLPHLLLLLVSLSLWPIILVQGVAGWLLGWLRYRSGSILPGWLAHSLANAFGALVAMS
jgi:uncharacterized protein